jgi:hypothetical protein
MILGALGISKRSRLRIRRGLGLLTLGLMAGALTGATATTWAKPPTLKECGLVTGAHFSYKAVGGHRLSGNRYSVTAAGISCASAESYASKLSHADPKIYVDTYELSLLYNARGTMFAHWPPEFTCAGNGYPLTSNGHSALMTRHKPPTISGFCWRGDAYDPYSPHVTAVIQWGARPG